tara:strand:- start:4253 stop:5683 length:1431 start_codon:yes stop_codon:yes gene_type:complete
MEKPDKTRILTVFTIVMITITSVDSIRNLPATALFGPALIFFFLIGAVLFLIPAALVSAELAAALPKRGGVYVWVREAFGVKWSFLAIWFQWVENVIWYPAILSFLAGTIAYLFDPSLAKNHWYLWSTIVIVYWGTTLVNLRGLKASAWMSVFCGMAGLVLPMTLIVLLGVIWIATGHPMQVSFSPKHLFPDLTDPSLLVSMTGVILSYSGIEIATVHAREAKNPQRDYPRALIISTVIIAGSLILGSLSIAIVVPHDQLSLVAGIMQAFTYFLGAYHLTWLVPFVAVFIAVGLLGSISNWTLAPIKGLLVAAQDGNLPPILQRENKAGAPSVLLIVQAVIVTLASTVFLFMKDINSAYWELTVVAAQLYMVMYIIMFAAGIYLRYKRPDLKRPFQVPGGNIGMWVVAGVGMATAIFTIVIGFFPPENMHIGSTFKFESVIIIGLLIMSIPPFIIYALRRPHWKDVAVTRALCGDE